MPAHPTPPAGSRFGHHAPVVYVVLATLLLCLLAVTYSLLFRKPPAPEAAPLTAHAGAGTTLWAPAEAPRAATRLTNHPANDTQPAWSPDGLTIVFSSDRIGGAAGYDVFAIDPDGTDERLVLRIATSADGRLSSPSWAGASGALLVGERNNFWEIFRVDLSAAEAAGALPLMRGVTDGDGRYMQRVLFVPGGKGAGSQVVSPDGTRVAWEAMADPYQETPSGIRHEVRVYDGGPGSEIGETDSAGYAVLRTEYGGFIGQESGTVAFSPDGRRLCVSACPSGYTSGRRRDLYVVDLATRQARRLTEGGEEGRDSTFVAWSSRDVIAFASRAGDEGGYDLYTISPDGSNLTRLTRTGRNEVAPSWSPDAESLVFASDDTGYYNLYRMEWPPGAGVPRASPARRKRRRAPPFFRSETTSFSLLVTDNADDAVRL